MTTYVEAYPAVYSRVHTKKDLKAAAAEGFNAELVPQPPLGNGRSVIGLNELPEEWVVQVTNHPKRSWFATVRRQGGKVSVK
jgi:hypothetical protein